MLGPVLMSVRQEGPHVQGAWVTANVRNTVNKHMDKIITDCDEVL